MDIERQINQAIQTCVDAVVQQGVRDLAEFAASDDGGFGDLISGFESGVEVKVDLTNNGRDATVEIVDNKTIGGKSRIKALNDGLPAYRQPSSKKPMPIPIGYQRKTTPRSLQGSAGRPATGTVYRYFRGPIEAGEWEEANAKRVRDAAQNIFDKAASKVR